MENEERIYICCEKAEGKENFTCIKTSKETSINLILTSPTLKHDGITRQKTKPNA